MTKLAELLGDDAVSKIAKHTVKEGDVYRIKMDSSKHLASFGL